MKWPIVTVSIEREDDIVAARQRARDVAEHLGFSMQDQTRIATAVSEIARNAFGYAGGGKVEYAVIDDEQKQSLQVRVIDQGCGIAELPAILEGRYKSATGMGLGIRGARRLMDAFDIHSSPNQGTTVSLTKTLPNRDLFTGPKVTVLAGAIARTRPENPQAAIQNQNRELLRSLSELSEREEEAKRLNRELTETNRGVVALHAELEEQAHRLREAGMTLELQVSERTEELAEANRRLLQEAAEREKMESDLRQSQKMEAVGQLTGGIAHDFNNLLTGIVGSLDVMQRRIARGQTNNLDRFIDAAVTSANRAAALTHRLLAFARRQPLDPKQTDANTLIVGMSDLLRRTMSESIELQVLTSSNLWQTLCDPHQLENAILNLAINARDAMPNGGLLTIETSNGTFADAFEPVQGATPSEYVLIRVTDTGTGMSPEVAARAFDPFFTTKPLGQGTGLGLSMIYGFTRQSEGHARIESRVGHGTSINLYLPRFKGDVVTLPDADIIIEHLPGAGETVLVVEDEPIVRDLIVEALQVAGYRTMQAVDGFSGLRILQSGVHLDLLVTDVGLPGMNGRQLADQARQSRPDLKVIFITGYAETVANASGFLDSRMAMVTKPFTPDALLSRIRAMIDSI